MVSSSASTPGEIRSEEHTSELQSRRDLVCRLLLEKKKQRTDVDGAVAVQHVVSLVRRLEYGRRSLERDHFQQEPRPFAERRNRRRVLRGSARFGARQRVVVGRTFHGGRDNSGRLGQL